MNKKLVRLVLYPRKKMAPWHWCIHACRCESAAKASFSRCYTLLALYPSDKLAVHYANTQHNKLMRVNKHIRERLLNNMLVCCFSG
jgi:hypothetical protein